MSSASDRRKSSGGDDGGGANWMDTYGDLVTLLLTFFVLLFSMSNIDARKWEALVGSFTGISAIGIDPISPEVAFENPIPQFGPPRLADDPSDSEDPDPSGSPSDLAEGDAITNLAQIVDILQGYIDEGGIDAELKVYEEEFVVRIIMRDMVFFDSGRAIVKPDAFPILDTMIEMFLEVHDLYSMLSVEGHTDIVPIATIQYPSNWELSADRALKVVSYIRADNRLDKSRMVAAGYGEEHPIMPNDSPENMAMNRRVEFVIEARGRRDNTIGTRRFG